MKILITGGAGYIGYSLVKQIEKSFNPVDEIIIYDNLSRKNYAFFTHDKFNQIPITFIHGDLLDGRKLENALKGVEIVYHLAAKVTTPFADNEAHSYDQVNHWGSAQLSNIIEEAEDVKHLIYLSSISVYGSANEAVDESYAPHPQSFYGISKYEGEKQINRLSSKLKVHIVRSGNVYGYNPSLRIDSVINRFMFDANFKGRIAINGSGEQMRSFIHVDKLAFVLKELLTKEVPVGIYNLMEHNLTINEVVDYVKEIYPEMESISSNINMKMRNISVATPCNITEYITMPQRSILDELHEFKVMFSF